MQISLNNYKSDIDWQVVKTSVKYILSVMQISLSNHNNDDDWQLVKAVCQVIQCVSQAAESLRKNKYLLPLGFFPP